MESNNISLFSIEFKKWWWEDAPGHMHSKIEERALYYQKYIYDIRKIIVDHSIDLVISSTVNVFQGALAAACEEVEHYWLIHEFPLGEFSYYQKLIPLIESLSSKLFAVQGSLTEYLKPYLENPQKISSFIPFSDITRGDQLKNINKSRIVSIGRINDNKNQLELLRAYSSLSQPLPELLFIGDWDESYKRKCDHYIKENKLSQASFIGHQSDPWKFLSNKDILVLNSKMETFGLVFVEALIKGIPVIAANNFGYQSVTDYFQFGHLYPSGDTEKLSQELTKLINYYPEYKTKAMNQRDKVMRQYTIEKAYHSIIEVIENDTTISPQKHTWLKPFLGAYNPQKIFSPADKDSITIYYCSSNEVWNEENTLVFPLKDSQVLYFEVPDFMTKLRIDMSEVPSYYDSIKLINVENGTQILPIRNTGFNFEDSYYFNHVDPQLEFNISYMGKKVFSFLIK
ncbi:glycosyltransferase [Streptococcus didelphis]|uniref:glycosyltransferase n=1 Tax=Streptococcus didelphis TaxID=102886 RepID=UPI0027D28458|nr:glycosyltransferase [Streptococcus didelphis]WMB29044.1 glycosyltransferase [Streptococcus didelphis]